MFYIFDKFISSHPRILISLGSFALPCILASSYAHVVCTWLYPCIRTSLYLQVHMPLLASLHPHILRFVCSCLYPCTSHPHILRLISVSFYTRILASSYPQIHVCLLVFSHPHILVSSGLCVLASILTSSGQCLLDTNE